MLHTVSPLILKLSLFLMTAVTTHLVMSFGQTLLHYKVAHHPIGGKLFRNHINFHHTHYADDHLVSRTYLGDEGNITPYFLIPVFLVGGAAYFLLPLNLFVVMVIASAASFYAHVFFDKEYHVEGSRLQRFAWFRRQQELHFVHHRHANSNFGVIHFFWDKDSRYLSKAECRCINQTPVTRLRFSIASQFEFCLSSQIASASITHPTSWTKSQPCRSRLLTTARDQTLSGSRPRPHVRGGDLSSVAR